MLAGKALSAGTLYDKVWDLHRVAELPGGATQLFIGLHLIHEVTSPQAFTALRDLGLSVRHPERTVATVDHIVPTTSQARPFADPLAEEMLATLEANCTQYGIRLHGIGSGRQGIGEGSGLAGGGHDVIHGGHRALGVAHREAQVLQRGEGLGAGDLMDQMQTDEQLGGAAWQLRHPVQIPDLVVQRCRAHLYPTRADRSP